MFHFSSAYANAIVTYKEAHSLPGSQYPNGYSSFSLTRFQSVDNGIFNKRLQCKLWNLTIAHIVIRRQADGKLEAVIKTKLLNAEIFTHIMQLVCQGNNVAFSPNTISEEG